MNRVIVLALFCQDLKLDTTATWEELARPWMTPDEQRLYDTLSPFDKVRFRGYFAMRRVARPNAWREGGLYLPYFFPKTDCGDIRDPLVSALGEPNRIEGSPERPLRWSYYDRTFSFLPNGGGQVKLTRESQTLPSDHDPRQVQVVGPEGTTSGWVLVPRSPRNSSEPATEATAP